jgi:hypothetical protein
VWYGIIIIKRISAYNINECKVVFAGRVKAFGSIRRSIGDKVGRRQILLLLLLLLLILCKSVQNIKIQF